MYIYVSENVKLVARKVCLFLFKKWKRTCMLIATLCNFCLVFF